ncbi:ribonucleoside-diphosphate reductase, adenosylcobalamin-dependent, partial [Candidatus Micrarchaeota archaeon]|nr:ribonucleoside-diphosphate reductase, adenosylcobalamin-dependent [Candidatus Micrarchaeota archaeon]
MVESVQAENGVPLVKKVRKRDGRLVAFDQEKIVAAIFKAARAVGGREKRSARKLSEKVVEKLEKKFGAEKIPTIEDVQDAVEEVLVEEGHAKTAKAYILYRRQRAELREEKKMVLEKDVVDEVDKQFDLNALRVLKSRYLKKDGSGRLVESPKQLFTRVAVHVVLPELLYDERVFDKAGGQEKRVVEAFNQRSYAGKFSIGFFELNEFHLEALKRTFDRMAGEGTMRVGWKEFLKMLEDKEFDSHETRIREFYELMVSK